VADSVGFGDLHVALLVVVVGGLQILRAGELPREFLWVVDEHGKMLRADPHALLTIVEIDERCLLFPAFAHEALFVTHDGRLSIRLEAWCLV
jgi:hypothetical protein